MKKSLLVLLSILSLFACSDKEVDLSKITIDPGFSDYVNAFTSGVISSKDYIKVELVEASEFAAPGEEIKEEIFEFEPALEGKAFWLDEHTVEFRPAEKLKSGKKYLANFRLEKLLDVPEMYGEMNFGFMVFHQNLFVEFNGVKSKDTEDYSKQELNATVRTADVADPFKLEKCFEANQLGKELAINWEHKEGGRLHEFTVLNVVRSNKESFVTINWNAEGLGVEKEDELELRVPPLGEFTVVKASVVNEPSVHFSIHFSDPIKKDQDLNGLVYLESGKRLRLKIKGNEILAYPSGRLEKEETIIVNQAVLNTKAYQLQSAYKKTLLFNIEKPSVELIGDGVIMPSNGAINFPFKAINLKAVNLRVMRIYENNINQFFQNNQHNGSSNLARVGRLIYDGTVDLVSSEAIDYGVWNNFKIDLNRFIETEPGAIYRVMMSYERYQSLYPCGDTLGMAKPMKRKKQNYDDDAYYMDVDSWFAGGYNYNERDNPCSDSYYKYYNRTVSKNVLASNFGIIAKEGVDNNFHVAVSDLISTNPMSDVTIEAYNYQNQLMTSSKTNSEGLCSFDAKGKPYLLVAKKGKQRGYLRVDNGSVLSSSLYEVGGDEVKKGLKGYFYGERGVWRPGDSLFLTFVLEDKLKSLPKTHPVIVELYDPLGKLFTKKVSSNGVKGMYDFTFKTNDDSPTGNWYVKAKVGNSEFYKTLKIETVKPNRIRVEFDFPEVLKSGQEILTNFDAKWLYGSPAANLKTRIELNVLNMKTSFKNYEDYQFDDRSRSYSLNGAIENEFKTNAKGNALVNFDWDAPSDAPGMLKMSFSTKIFEEGGDFSQDYISKKYSPYKSYVGIKMQGGENWRKALDSEETHAVSLAAVNEDGKPLTKNVKIELYKVSYNWWWEGNGEDELTNYISRKSKDLIKSYQFTIKNGKSNFDLKFPKRGWGKYMLRVIDKESGHSALKSFYADYSGWYTDGGANTEAASMLNLETDKKDYKVGETAKISIPSGGVGRFYVTIEKGDRVLKSYWVDAEDKATILEVETSKDMAPNVYVSASLIQPHGQEENALPIRMYGIVPLNVSDPKTYLNPIIKAPNTVQPQSEFKVKVKEKDGKKMAYTVAIVDEGLLSLTRFKTPNPWTSFYKKEALSVKSWDMYKYVMSAQAGKMAALLAIGGDEGLVYKEDASANRFKPVVQYLGPFYLEAGDEAVHSIKLPNYIGAVRVMVVAAHEGAYGSSEKEIQVKKPLMVQATLPRVLGPSEELKIPVNVISMGDKIKKVKVKVSTNDYLIKEGSNEQIVNFTEKGDKTVYFDYKVAHKLGVAKFKVEVSAGAEKSFEEIEILVRPSNPKMTKSTLAVLDGNESWEHSIENFGIQGTNEAIVEISRIPDLNLEKQLSYLIRYPHGCIEQTTSAVFPQLFLENLLDLNTSEKIEIKENVNAAIDRLKSFQIVEGGFAYWPGGDRPASEWGTNYAGHFMIEAKNKGYEVPENLFNNWLRFQKDLAVSWNRSDYRKWGRYNGDLTQAYRLYTLALAGKAEIGAMNRLKNDVKLSQAASWRLAAAYAIIGHANAAATLSKGSYEVPEYRSMGYSYGSNIRDKAMILETMIYLKDSQRGGVIVKEIAKDLSRGWHSTQTRAYALLAIAKFVGDGSVESGIACALSLNGNSVQIESDKSIHRHKLDVNKLKNASLVIENKGGGVLFLNLEQTGIPTESQASTGNNDLEMSIKYVDNDGKQIDVSRIVQGTDFKAVISIHHPGIRNGYKEMALNQIFPSGWQILNARLSDDYQQNSKIDYQDIRDDRVYSYFDLSRSETITIEVNLNATFLGKYYLPSVFCAPMYDESIYALEAGKWVEVVKE